MASEGQPLSGRLSLPAKNWAVTIELPGFRLDTVVTRPDGRRYMLATNKTTGVIVSVTLEEAPRGKPVQGCAESLRARVKNQGFKLEGVRFSQFEGFEVLEYLIPELKGFRLRQGNLFACQVHDDVFVDIHLSKVNYTPGDEQLFHAVLATTRILEGIQRTSRELFEEGSRYYLRRDYKNAIGPYSQALELERKSPQIEKALWYVLVDNLGMAYGITGDLEKAKETFEYGLSKDPRYPFFYYNLACTFAEEGDADRAAVHLKRAFEFKENVLPGEQMPDPTKDDSFKKLMKNKEFRELANSLAATIR